MNLKMLIRKVSRWVLPGGIYKLLVRKFRIDINETISPIQLRHVRRYEFAKEHVNGSVLLDAACGTGYGSDLLGPFEQYVGVDYADYCIDYANARYEHKNKRFICADVTSLNDRFKPKSFDTIISFETLEHLDDPKSILEIFMQLLSPTGHLIISIPLNHPDTVYHKRQYSHADVQNMFAELGKKFNFGLEEYLQAHLKITKLTSPLARQATGTWLGVLLKSSF